MSVKIYDKAGELIRIGEYREAKLLINRNEASWKGYNSVQLIVDTDEVKRKGISKALRETIIAEEKRFCYICNKHISRKEYATIDHLVSSHQGGKTVRKNLKCCCERCNKDKGSLNISDYYKQIMNNRKQYNYISDAQLVKLRRIVNETKKNFPIITAESDNNLFKVFVNGRESLKISKYDNLSNISEEILRLLKDFNSDYILNLKM